MTEMSHGTRFVFGLGFALSAGAFAGGNSDRLLSRAERTLQRLEALEHDASAVRSAFELVEEYDREVGPLFLNERTRNGFPRKPKAGLELEYAMFAIQQALIDKAYTPENLKAFRRTLDGVKLGMSAYFPGAVAAPVDPGSASTVRINASQPTAWGSPVMGRDNPARRPTGCYLAPGSIGVVAVPPAMVGKGYVVRVGAHSWDLKKKRVIKRLDRVSLLYPIAEVETLIANPLGGGIYIEVPYEADAGVVEIRITNTVRSPFFSARSFQKTTLAEWKTVERNHPGPWADFESDNFMMQVPANWVRKHDDPVTLMRDWDKAMDGVSELFGYPLVRPKTVLYLQVDATMRGNANFPGYPQSNYPYNPHEPGNGDSEHWIVRGPQFMNWTVLHEVGHSQLFSKFRGEVEAVVNLPHVAVMNRKFGVPLDEAFGDSVTGKKQISLDQAAIMWMVTENFRQGNPMNISNRPGDEVKYQHRGYGKYVEIANLFGWSVLERFWRAGNESWKPGDPSPQNADPTDDRILRLSRAAGVDLTPLIHFWGIQPEAPEALAETMRNEGLKPSPRIRERLQHYKTVIPMDNTAFRAHADVVYPNGLGKPKNPRYGAGWYEVWMPKYNEGHGQAAQTALQRIIDLYFHL